MWFFLFCTNVKVTKTEWDIPPARVTFYFIVDELGTDSYTISLQNAIYLHNLCTIGVYRTRNFLAPPFPFIYPCDWINIPLDTFFSWKVDHSVVPNLVVCPYLSFFIQYQYGMARVGTVRPSSASALRKRTLYDPTPNGLPVCLMPSPPLSKILRNKQNIKLM